MDKTFAEVMGYATFDWNKALDNAIKKEPDSNTRGELGDLASLWTTCACGNACAIIPRRARDVLYASAPLDDVLFDLGMKFYNYISYANWKSAKCILVEIEMRSEELIKIELAKLNK